MLQFVSCSAKNSVQSDFGVLSVIACSDRLDRNSKVGLVAPSISGSKRHLDKKIFWFIIALLLSVGTNTAFSQGSIQFQVDNQSPNSGGNGCPNTEVWYVLAVTGGASLQQDPNFNVTGGGQMSSLSAPENCLTCIRKKVIWASSGTISVTYTPTGGSEQSPQFSFTTVLANAGTIDGPSQLCEGTAGILTVSGESGPVTYQYWTGSVWSDLPSNSTGTLSSTTTFRTRSNNVTCGVVPSSNTKTVTVRPRVSNLAGATLPSSIYVGSDPITTSVSASQADSFSWTITSLTGGGSPGTIADITSGGLPPYSQVRISWTGGYTGVARITVVGNGCDGSVTSSIERNVTIQPIPTPQFQVVNGPPSSGCVNSTTRYALVFSDQNTVITSSAGSATGGSVFTVSNLPNHWDVVWGSDGDFTVTYSFTMGSNSWNNQQLSRSFDVTEAVPGVITATSYTACSGQSSVNGTLSIANNSGAVTWKKCTTNCELESNWIPSTTSYTVSETTKFRATLNFSGCGIQHSNVIQVTYVLTPDRLVLGGTVGVCDGHLNEGEVRIQFPQPGVTYNLFRNGENEFASRTAAETDPPPVVWSNRQLGVYTATGTRSGCTVDMLSAHTIGMLLPSVVQVTSIPGDQMVCDGAQVTLTVTGLTDINWTSTNGGVGSEYQSSVIHPTPSAPSTTYTVSGLDANCHTIVSGVTKLITVKARPQGSNSSLSICSGEVASILLPASQPNISYTWTVSNPTIEGEASSPFSVNAPYTISQTLSTTARTTQVASYAITPSKDGCAGPAFTASVSVNPRPSASVSNLNIFSGQTANLVPSADVAGTLYTWEAATATLSGSSSNTTSPASEISQQLENTTSGDELVEYTITPTAAGCAGEAFDVDVGVFPLPVITSTTNVIAKGAVATLSTTAFESYEWKRGITPNVSTAQSFPTSQPGSYTVTVTRDGATGTSAAFELLTQFGGLDMNYIVTDIPQVETSDPDAIASKPVGEVSQSVVYYDGLGRPIQTVTTQTSPAGQDLVLPNVYDAAGREFRKFLPVAVGTDGRYKNDILTTGTNPQYTGSFYSNPSGTVASDIPYSDTKFENSPLNRVIEQGAPGAAWQPNENNLDGHTVKMQYKFNVAVDSIVIFNYNEDTHELSLTPGPGKFYSPNVLYAKVTIEEHGNDVVEFVNKQGQTICKKVKSTSAVIPARTYYVYDSRNNLVFVLPPEGTRQIMNRIKYGSY